MFAVFSYSSASALLESRNGVERAFIPKANELLETRSLLETENAQESQLTEVRSKRSLGDILNSIYSSIIKVVLGTILTPIQSIIDSLLTSVASTIQSFYISTIPSNVIFAFLARILNVLVLRLAQGVLLFEEALDVLFNYLIYGNATGST